MALECLLDLTGAANAPEALYTDLRLPEPPPDRPYTYVNMVSTADGKILLGPPGTTAKGLGGPTDQALMRRLQNAADAAMIGAGSLRVGNVIYDPRLWRATATRSGDLPLDNRFFTDAPGKAIVFAPETLSSPARERLETRAQVRIAGRESVDAREAARMLRQEFGIRKLALEGGPDLNFSFFEAGMVDELFLTLAPKIKGGTRVPTAVTGPGLPDSEFVALELISLYRDGDEVYFRYRVDGRPHAQ